MKTLIALVISLSAALACGQWVPLPEPFTIDGTVTAQSLGHVCTDNTTTNLLGNGEVFTGTWQDVRDYGVVSIGVSADQNSATDGLVVQWSPNGTDISSTDVFTITANQSKTFSFGPADRYVRLKYTNGATPQTSFYLNTILRDCYVKPSSHRIQDSIVAEDDAELVKAVITGENPGGTFVNFQSTTAGNFKISLEELESGISDNSNTQLKTTQYASDGTEVYMDANGVQGVMLMDNLFNPLSVDDVTASLITVDYAHHELHEGDHFFAGIVDSDLDTTQTNGFVAVVPDDLGWPHVIFQVESSLASRVEIWEGATLGAAGTSVTAYNNNRNSSNTAGMSVYQVTDSTISSYGTMILTRLLGSTSPLLRAGGSARGDVEIIGKQNTTYVVLIIGEADNGRVNASMSWYEHTSLN